MNQLNELYKHGAKVGLITQSGGHYHLLEFAVAGILPGRSGDMVLGPYMPTPYTVDEIADNTALLLCDQQIVLVMRPFLSSIPGLRKRICRWIQWANENPNDVRSVMQGPARRKREE